MCNLKLSVFFIALSVTLSCLEATPIENSHHLEKRKCNTATCVTQRLADFLVRSGNNIGAIYSPTNVGSNTYGKRDTVGLSSRESQNNA
uniref:Uncharacterized protein n=1 Tax=Melopsittacus undulatus TaxID=13146 RepID=A0A8C6J4P7_MELUD